jgi:hypothetical protein
MSLKLGAMQPYLFPYLGYFQLIKAVDVFIILDTVQYIKQGWINRNYILHQGRRKLFTLPLVRAGSFRPIMDKQIADESKSRKKILTLISDSYREAPFFQVVFPLLEEAIGAGERRLDLCLQATLKAVCGYLEIPTPLIPLSRLPLGDGYKGLERILALCRHFQATEYLNPLGGLHLYPSERFAREGVRVFFLKSIPLEYPQFGNPFVPQLSIIDLMMFNPRETLKTFLSAYDLFDGKAVFITGASPS